MPNFGVFDEKRYFAAGDEPCVFEVDGFRLGLTICEDVWHAQPVADCASAGADFIVNLNASPYDLYKAREREEEVVSLRAKTSGVPIIYVNLVGGQDELVFDGGSFVCAADGEVIAREKFFEESLSRIDLTSSGIEPAHPATALLSREESVYQALCVLSLIHI